MSPVPSVVIGDVTFAYSALGEPVLDHLSATIPDGRTGLVGRNGSGKTTLVRLIRGDLSPTSGTILGPLPVNYLPQRLLVDPHATVASVLGIAEVMAALRAIEAGSLDQSHFDVVGDDWDVEARATALLAKRVPTLSLDGVLDRAAATLSGGELTLSALAGFELAGAPVTLLDEPTNNLDARSRKLLIQTLDEWGGSLLVVSHDVEVLRHVDQILELRDGVLTLHGGTYDDYVAQLATARAAAEQAIRAADQSLKAEQRDRQHVQTATARRARANDKAFTRVPGGPRLGDATYKRAAEARRAKENERAARKVNEARDRLAQVEADLRDDESIHVDVVEPGTPASRRLAELVGTNRTVHVGGRSRIALVGDNGVGKSTLLRSLLDGTPTLTGARALRHTERWVQLDQQLRLPDASVLDAVRETCPQRDPVDLRNRLARLLIRGDMVHRHTDELSGGERLKVALARVLLADPPAELLVLDEPSNNLDLDGVEQLVVGLNAYRGGLVIVTHDAYVLENLQLDEIVELRPDGNLT